MACLDTCVLLDLMRRGAGPRRRQATALLKRLVAAGEDLATTRFTMAELLVGVERAPDPAREQEAVRAALADLELLEFDERTARAFAKISAHLQEHGRPVGDMDVLIASVALVNGHGLVTRNPRHFAAIPGLKIESY